MSKRKLAPAPRVLRDCYANISPHEKERMRLIELRLGDAISKADYERDMRAVDEAERKAVAR